MIGFYQLARGKSASSNTDDALQSTSAAAKFGTSGIVIKSLPGRLYKVEVVNVSATAYFLMLFDKATAPVNGDTPVIRRRLPVSGEVVVDFTALGWTFANGIGLALSSTDGTLTLAVSLDGHFQAQFK